MSADSRVVAVIAADSTGYKYPMFVTSTFTDLPPGTELVPLSLIAEAESRERGLMELCGARFHEIASLTKERDSLQSRLDAVVRLADRWKEKYCDPDGHMCDEVAHELSDEIRSAALGGES